MAEGKPPSQQLTDPQHPSGPGELMTLGRFEIRRELARGGMGVIYEAVDPKLGRPIALKVMLGMEGSSLTRFRREARLAGQLRHPNIITIHEIGEVDGTHFIVMDLVVGQTFAEAMPELSLEQGIEILEQVADAIGYAHGQGVLHRDLKPANILLAQSWPTSAWLAATRTWSP